MKGTNANEGSNVLRLMLGYLCIASEREASLVAKVQILDRFDLPDAEIGKICSISVQAVRNARLRSKISNKRKK